MKYWAFLSYSHTDKKWGDWLHKALETYRVPRRLIGKETRDGKVPERVYPIFRDREELPVSADLGANINEALKESRYLIVICSPRSAQSRWVGEEIKTFKKLGREDRILALIVDGEPNASDDKPGFKIEDECFHEAMRYRMVDGEVSEIRSEPIAADAREGKDGKSNAKLKLLAGLLGVNYDDLKQREQERRLRRARIVVAAAVVLIGIFAALSVALFFNARAARLARDEARTTLSRSDFLQALRSVSEGRDLDALAQLARSLRNDPNNNGATCRLATLLQNRAYPTPILSLPTEAYAAEFSPDGKKILTLSKDKTARIWAGDTGQSIGEPMSHGGLVLSGHFSPDGARVVTASMDNTARIWDSETGHPITPPMKHDAAVNDAQFTSNGRRIVTVSGSFDSVSRAARVWDATTGKPLTDSLKLGRLIGAASFTPDGKHVVSIFGNVAGVWDVETGKPVIEPIKHPSAGDEIRGAVGAGNDISPDGEWLVGPAGANEVQVKSRLNLNPVGKEIGHGDLINAARFSPDGKLVATASSDNTARVWDSRTGEPVSPVIKHDGHVLSVEFSPDSKRIVTASLDDTARVWDAVTGQPLTPPMRHEESGGLKADFSADGMKIVTASFFGNAARVWDSKTGKPLTEPMSHGDDDVDSAQFSPDGRLILTVSANQTIRLWNAITGKPVGAPIQFGTVVSCVKFSPDGKYFAAAAEKNARIWNALTREPATPLLECGELVEALEFTPDGKYLTTAAVTSQLWEVATGKRIIEPLTHTGSIDWAEFSPDGNRIVTASSDRSARIWDAQTGAPLTEKMEVAGSPDFARFSSDGKRVVTRTFGAGKESVRVWDSATGKSISEPIKFDQTIWSVCFSRDDSRIATASNDTTVRIWQSETGKPTLEPLKHDAPVQSARFSPDGTRVLTVSNSKVRIWQATAGKSLPLQLKEVERGQFTRDSKRLVLKESQGRICFQDAATGARVGKPIGTDPSDFAISHDEKSIATISAVDRTARVWDAVTGEQVGESMKYEEWVTFVEFSPDDRMLVTLSTGGIARLWDAATGRPVGKPLKHDKGVRSVRFSPDSKRLVTTSNDGVARVWDTRTGEPSLPPLQEEMGALGYAEFSPDGKRILTNERIWNAETGKPLSDFLKRSGQPATSASFSSDGRRVVTASVSDHTAQVWDLNGKALTEPMVHDLALNFARFSQDGQRIVTQTYDGPVRVWDSETAKAVAEPMEQKSSIGDAQFSPDGKRLVTFSFNHARIWDFPPTNEIPDWLPELAETIAGQRLNDRGFFEPLSKERIDTLKQIRARLEANQSKDDDWAIWGRWFLKDPQTRTISPFSKVTVSEYIENRIKENTAESLDEAQDLAIGNPELLRRIAHAKELLAPKTENEDEDEEKGE